MKMIIGEFDEYFGTPSGSSPCTVPTGPILCVVCTCVCVTVCVCVYTQSEQERMAGHRELATAMVR